MTLDDSAPILRLGLLQPRTPLAECLAAIERTGVEAAAELLHFHKVRSIARDRIAELRGALPPAESSLLNDLHDRLDEKARLTDVRGATTDTVHRLVGDVARKAGVPWWTMKGHTFRRLYPDGLRRDVGDLDVLVDDIDAAWALAEGLRRHDYAYPAGELPWFKKDTEDGRLYGQIRLVAPDRERLSIDVHAGPYSVRHCGLMRLGRSGGPAEPGPISFDDDVCAVIANAAGDCFVNAKLANDLVLALDAGFDHAYVLRTLDGAGLLPFLQSCLIRLREWCDLSDRQRAALARLTTSDAPEPLPPVSFSDPAQRCATTVEHARVIAGRKFPDDPGRVEEIVTTAEDAYGKDHPLEIVPDGETFDGGLPPLNNWTCVRLVPIPLAAEHFTEAPGGTLPPGNIRALTDRLGVIDYGGNAVVHAARERFVPTVTYRLPAPFVRALLPHGA
ncbi:nucleotidyltransferase family protein [Actinomadura rayongensis]|uniref:Nucleotidyltransferase family protein n=1 Tax=Actinomadura rayongensis TaxID=1429076 RepID=A0A6I4WDE1_9ACTN|nr:nucleotidyltransferase family protein [Actinomadura rayongensis]MXQ66275.1 hypothetical protein [Actinomadura rayongensis]